MSPSITLSVVLGLLAYAGAVNLWKAYKKRDNAFKQECLLRARYEGAVDTVKLLNQWECLNLQGSTEEAFATEVLGVLAERDARVLAQAAANERTAKPKPGSWT